MIRGKPIFHLRQWQYAKTWLKPCLLGIVSLSIAMPIFADTLTSQRDRYELAKLALKARSYDTFAELRATLVDYPLVPYLDYRSFKQSLSQKTPKEVTKFIDQHQALPFSKRLRAPYLALLFQQQAWADLLQFQTEIPIGERYQCMYYTALFKQGETTKAFKGAQNLWLNGQSVAKECDELFTHWNKAGLRSDAIILERMQLAFAARNGSLMRYLSRLLESEAAQQQASVMINLQRFPHKVMQLELQSNGIESQQTQSALALKQWAKRDLNAALHALKDVAQRLKWPEKLQQDVAESMAWQLFQTDDAALAQWRDSVISRSTSPKLLERRIRLALQEGRWGDVLVWIAQLPETQQQSLRWQYWLGRAELALGSSKQGQGRLEGILGQRNFYSVAAAQALSVPYRYPVKQHSIDEAVIEQYRPAFERIDELIAIDKIAAAKSEWRHTLDRANQSERETLALYAAKQRWHHLTVTASIEARMWGNLQVRFPLAHRWWFDLYAKKHRIDPITLLALARQESALDIEAHSPVGARGIMQIMPKTAQYTARKYDIDYQGSQQLYDVGKNIEIGSQYLKGLLDQYDNNRIFALAAYNAGPHRVKTWRARTKGKVDALAFIEAIPFRETRGYVQNILMFETYYRHLLDKNGAFLKQHELNRRY